MNVQQINPQQLISPKRLDVLCKYHYFFEMLQGYSLGRTRSFYRNHIEQRTKGVEPDDQAGAFVEKVATDDYEIELQELVDSLKKDGFKPEFAIPYFANGQILNGAHRLAASLALGQDIYAELVDEHDLTKQQRGEIVDKNAPETGRRKFYGPPFWDFKWFVEHGFDLPEQLNLLYDYAKLQQGKTAVFVFWEPSAAHWQEFAQLIDANMDIVGDVPLQMPSGIAMYELVQDIYKNFDAYGAAQNPVCRKGALLAQGNRRLHVILAAHNSQKNAGAFYDVVREVKEACRELADNTVDKRLFLTLHASDSADETWHMAQTLFSANSLSHLFSRAVFPARAAFLQQLYKLPKVCAAKNIDINNVCVVGSGTFEVIGVRQAADIDITLIAAERAIHTADNNKTLGSGIDIASAQYHRRQDGVACTDDFLISHPDMHFMYRGIKFANVDVVLDRKSLLERDKDKADMALFNEFIQRPVPDFEFGAGFAQALEVEKQIRGI